MLRLLAVIAAAAARPENATAYFDAAGTLCRACWRRVRNRSRPFAIPVSHKQVGTLLRASVYGASLPARGTASRARVEESRG